MKKLSAFLLLFLLLSCAGSAQLIDSMMHIYSLNVPQEKTYVQFDKSVYRAGETIWFKGYIFDGYAPSVNSHNFYAELVDQRGNILQRKVYPVAESSSSGFFDIPDSAAAGVYTFRGYTSWMLNMDTAFLFYKDLSVLTKAGEAATGIKSAGDSSPTLISFFPEGGNLVAGVESIVAFKANDNRGLPVRVSGQIIDSKGAIVANFTSVHDGMGKFNISPQANETYTARWKDEKGVEQTTALPTAMPQGATLSAYVQGDKIVFKVSRSDDAPSNMRQLSLIGHLAQERVYRARVLLDNSTTTSGVIPVKGFPSGVMQLTLFDGDQHPLAERIVLINNDNYQFDVHLTTPEVNMNKRAKNVVQIELPDTLLANMSLAITDADVEQPVHADNMISRMLLTGDIKGYVHQPGYYFSNNSDSLKQQLDLVMLTHGWRRFNWELLMNKKLPFIKYPKDSYLSLQAKVFGVPGYKINNDEQIVAIIQTKDSATQVFQLLKTGADQFGLNNIIFFDTAKVFYQFAKQRQLEKQGTIVMDNNFIKGYKRINLANRPVYIPPSDGSLSRSRFMAQQIIRLNPSWKAEGNVLQSVTVKTRAKSPLELMDERYTSGLFSSNDAFSFDMNDPFLASSLDVFSFLRGRVPGIQISSDNQTITWRGSGTSLFLNEMPVDVEQLSGVSVNDIAYIKVFRPPFFGATGGGAGGAIAVYLKKGGEARTNMSGAAGLSRSQVVGYSAIKEFYSPNYSTRSASSDVVADYRTTLYWQPNLFMDGSRQKVTIEFYNNDISRAYRLVLEGFNEVGKLVRIEKLVQQ